MKCSGLARSLARRIPPVTMSAAPTRSPATSGSSRNTSAVATAKRGAVPTVTEVRDAPASRTPNVKRIWAIPGASSPARTNGHALARSQSPRAKLTTSVTEAAGTIVNSDPTSGGTPVRSAIRTRTVIAPNRKAESAPRTTALTPPQRGGRAGGARMRRPAPPRGSRPSSPRSRANPTSRAPRRREGHRRVPRRAPRA